MQDQSSKLQITEIFHSIQGESSYAGLPFVFIRLTGCHLRCTYCDTEYAFHGGQTVSFDEIYRQVAMHQTPYVEITGGEPMLQKATPQLAIGLLDKGYTVLIETSGACDLSGLDPRVIKIMDLKCPSSGECEKNFWKNLEYLQPHDEIKFVIGSREDFDWAKAQIENIPENLRERILFSPVFEKIQNQELASWVLNDQLQVRMQLQMHKYIWDPQQRGV